MARYFSLIGLAFVVGVTSSGYRDKEDCHIRTDGLYYVHADEDGDGFNKYLRFYDDDTVIAVLSTDELEQVASWLGRSLPDASKGKYKMKKCKLSFKTENSAGSFRYKGVMTHSRGLLEVDKYYPDKPHPQHLTFHFKSIKLAKY